MIRKQTWTLNGRMKGSTASVTAADMHLLFDNTGLITPDETEFAIETAIAILKGDVPEDGDTLAKQYAEIAAIKAIIGGTNPDGDSLVDTVAELLAVFQTYPEGTDIFTLLSGKVDISSIVNTLTETGSGKVLDARQGKVLSDLITALTTTVGDKVDKIAGKGLSTEDYTTTEKTKLGTIASGAGVSQLASTISNFAAAALALVLTGLSTATGGAITSADSILAAFGKLQYQITNLAGIYQVLLTDVNTGSLLVSFTAKSALVDADSILVSDSGDGGKAKKTLLSSLKSFLKTYFDTLYGAHTEWPETAYSQTPTWAFTTSAPTGGTLTWRATQIGKKITVRVNALYSTPGVACTGVSIPLPTGLPLPSDVSGFAGANNVPYPIYGGTTTSLTNFPPTTMRMGLKRISAGSWAIEATMGSGNYTVYYFVAEYWTD